MSNNQIPSHSSVTSDGRGHYVVHHEPLQNPQHPAPSPILLSSSTPGILPSSDNFSARPRILARPTGTISSAVSLPFTASDSNSSVGKSVGSSGSAPPSSTGVVTLAQPEMQPQISTQSVLTIMKDEPSGTYSTVNMSQAAGSLTLYSSDSRVSSNEPMLATSTTVNYTTLSTMDNYNMSNIFVESLPPPVENNTVLMAADNQLYNIQNNGEAMLFCPSSISSDHGSINLLPIIDTASSAAQIQFPIPDVVSGNNVFEFIALPNDSTITSFSDQPILGLSNGTTFGNVIPISQHDSTAPLVYSIQDSQGMTVPSSMRVVQNDQNSFTASDMPFQATSLQSAVTTLAPTVIPQSSVGLPAQSARKRTVITLVDDFSDLIKTEPTDGRSGWGMGSEPELGTCFGTENADGDSSGDGSGSSLEDSAELKELMPEELDQELVQHETKPQIQVLDKSSNGIDSTDDSAFQNKLKTPLAIEDCRGMVVSDVYKEVKDPETVNVMMPDPAATQICIQSSPAIEEQKEINVNKPSPPMLRITEVKMKSTPPKKPVQIQPKKTAPKKQVKSGTPVKTVAATLNDFTSITLRQSMEKVRVIETEVQLASKPKVAAPEAPSIPLHIQHNLSKPVRSLEWKAGVGTISGLTDTFYQFRVNESTGILEMVDYNPADHQRRVPLKIMKTENFANRKSFAPKTKSYFKTGKTNQVFKGDANLPQKMKIAAKTIAPSAPLAESDSKDSLQNIQFIKSPCPPIEENDDDAVVERQEQSQNESGSVVTFCITCGILANNEKEFNGKRCKRCYASEPEVEEEESPNMKFKIPKGITIVKTSKRLVSEPSDNMSKPRKLLKAKPEHNAPCTDVVVGKKSVPRPPPVQNKSLPGLSPVDSKGITVIPIFQTPVQQLPQPGSSASDEPNSESKAKKRKYRRRLIEQKKLKNENKDHIRKRSFEKVLNAKKQYITKGQMVSNAGSSAIDPKSPGGAGTSESDEPSNKSAQMELSRPQSLDPGAPPTDFNWTKYLQETASKGAPARLFRQPAFPPPNPFKTGMMLEAIDPQHQSLFCVSSIVDVQGYRLRIHLTGYSEMFDFWVNADSYEIFPPGWCEEHGYKLEPPPNIENFNWHKYLIDEQLVPAEREFFAISKEEILPPSDIQVGMKLEAVDIRNMTLTCVATVQNIINHRLLIHFDSWDCTFDYWTDIHSPFIHPVGYCKRNGIDLTPPKNYKGAFSWENYLAETDSVPVPSLSFHPLPPIGFKKGMKLECVDKRNPFLIRVATIAAIENCEEHQLLIHFDGWPAKYDYSVYECSGDLHPPGWCAATGHPLQFPPDDKEPWAGACNIFGCLGLGHMKGYKYLTHNNEVNCPYSPANLEDDWMDLLPDRFVSYKKSVIVTQQHEKEKLNSSSRASSSSTNTEIQTTFAKAAKLRSEKRKSLATDIPVPAKRKYTKRNSESAAAVAKTKRLSTSEGENLKESGVKDKPPPKRPGRPPKSKQQPLSEGTPKPPPQVQSEPDSLAELAKRIIIPNIESTITPVLPPTSTDGTPVKVHWEDIIDSVVKDIILKKAEPDTSTPEFTLPASTTMTPIPTPGTSASSTTSSTESFHSKIPDQLVMICSQKSGGELTISQCSNDSSGEESASGGNSSSKESDSDVPMNYAQNIETLQEIVLNLDQATVAKWKTKDVVEFVRKIPGCVEVSALFGEHKIDGEAFLLMTVTDFSEIMGLKMGPCIKLSHAIRLVQKNTEDLALPAVSIIPIPASSAL